MSDSGYSGWSNYETWNLALWIGNELGPYQYWRRRCQLALNETDADNTLEERRGEAVLEVADRLRDKVMSSGTLDALTGYEADILRASLESIDYREIAESWLDDLTPED